MGEADEHEQALMRDQGKTDWRNFVISRGRELKPGGILITVNGSAVKGCTSAMYLDKGLHHLGSFVSDMARDGVITQDEFIATNLPLHHIRTEGDFEEPFTSEIPEVAELGLELVSMKSMKNYLKHPLYDNVWKDDAEKMEYSKRIVAMVYPWMHHVLHGGLSESRTEAEKEVIIEQYFKRVQEYAFAYSEHKPYISVTEVVIQKRPK
ncbi:uncharacterized protein LOC117340688 [Pecten maximus]|uniref:uncharacterized protein LOC117340688 n=1 Tax=Pecten maximus TaxID=6579 RepID=UPI0014582AD0|nr:uncharacterized protein LOC117340688 [Pecten maximus]